MTAPERELGADSLSVSENTLILVFEGVWLALIAAPFICSGMYYGQPAKRGSSRASNLLVFAPFVIVLSLFWMRTVGQYDGTAVTKFIGFVAMLFGFVGYVASHVYLRGNWSVSNTVKQGHQLITGGPYRWIRHPMYASMILIVLGSGMILDNYLIIGSSALVTCGYVVRARAEESLLRAEFAAYRDYQRKTRMLVPFIL